MPKDILKKELFTTLVEVHEVVFVLSFYTILFNFKFIQIY